MSGFNCRGGHRIDTTTYPNDVEFTLVPDLVLESGIAACADALESFCAAWSDNTDTARRWVADQLGPEFTDPDPDAMIRTVVNELIMRLVVYPAKPAIRCPVCGRLYVKGASATGEFASFVPEHSSGTATLG